MSSLFELQQRFAAALRDPQARPPVASSPRRFGVHRNNVAAGIFAVVAARFPAVRRIVGDDFFLAMASSYIEQSPPRSPILMRYGETFATFVAGFEPAADVPYLADVARLEWLQHEAYHAADATPIAAQELASVALDRIAELKFRLHPTLRLFASELPALSIWRTNAKPGEVLPAKFATEPEYALILRPSLEVDTHRIDAAMYAFVAALHEGQALVTAAERAMSRANHVDLQTSLASLITMGALIGYDLPADKGTS